MSSIVVSGDTSGSITLAVPAVAGTNTVTIAAQTGTLYAAAPTFRAFSSGSQSISNSTYTKITLNNENFDTNNNFDSTTNYRFTPTIAGYYQINGQVFFTGNALGQVQIAIYKNGTQYNFGSGTNNNTNIGGQAVVSDLVYMNGTTDYVELFGWQGSGGSLNTFTSGNYMSGFLVRGA
jgi:hypothetical protein